MTSFDRKKYFEEKRKMKKKLEKERKLKKKAEKARLQKFAEDMELSQPPKNQEESRMEEESMPMEEPLEEHNINSDTHTLNETVTKTSDLEDGELEDE